MGVTRDQMIESVIGEGFSRRSEMARLKKDGWVVERGSYGWVATPPKGYKLTQAQEFWVSGDHEFGTKQGAWDWVFDTASRNKKG